MPSALNACTAWPWIVCLYVCDCTFVEITRGPVTSSSRIFPSIRANYCVWGITKHPQHSTNTSTAGNPSSQADQHTPCPTWPSCLQHHPEHVSSSTCVHSCPMDSVWKPHDLPALEEAVFREPHLWSKYLSL